MFGTGYVGGCDGSLPRRCEAQVLCVDVDQNRIQHFQGGSAPICEPGLEELVRRNLADGDLSFSCHAEAAVRFGDLLFMAVGTPPDEDGAADHNYVLGGQHHRQVHDAPGRVIDNLTVPVRTVGKVGARIRSALAERGVSHSFQVVSNPEFLKEGAVINDAARSGGALLPFALVRRQTRSLCRASTPFWFTVAKSGTGRVCGGNRSLGPQSNAGRLVRPSGAARDIRRRKD